MRAKSMVEKLSVSADGYPERIFASRGKIYTCVNPYSYHMVRTLDVYERMDGLFADGMFMCMMVYALWGRRIPRLSFDMSGMAHDLFKSLNSPDRCESIYLVGARQEQLENTVRQIKNKYPDLCIKGFRNGYFIDDSERRQTIERIVSENPDYAVVGMGSPLQEQFAIDLKDAGFKGCVFTCGGFLHQTANNIYYYPRWIDKYNLRAFYRLFHEKNMFRRLYNVLLEFPILFTYDTMRERIGKKYGTIENVKNL